MATTKILTQNWPLTALIGSALALAVAHLSELAGLTPCPLCLHQRQAHWLAIFVAGLGFGLARTPLDKNRTRRLSCTGLGLCYLAGAFIALYHSGVEWGWLPEPDTCSGSGRRAAAGLAEILNKPIPVISCSDAPFRFVGLSMAGWNALYSLALATLSFRATLKKDPA